MTSVRSRALRVALPLCLALPAAVAGPAPVQAQEATPAPAASYLGHLVEDAEGDARYVVVDEASGREVLTTRDDAVDGALRPARDGVPSIAYVAEGTDEASVQTLRLVTPDGQDTVLEVVGADREASEPVFSPDGSTLAYVVDDEDGSSLRLLDVATRTSSAFRSSSSTLYYGPSFSPDGAYLSWAQETDDGSDLATGQIATGVATVVASSESVSWDDTSWSPDGTRLVATRTALEDEDDPGALVLVEVRNGLEQVLVRGSVGANGGTLFAQPTWTASGRDVLASRVTLTRASVAVALVRLPVAGGATEVVPTTGYAGSPSSTGPRPAGDGTAPPAVTDVTSVVSSRSARLRYLLPADADLADVVVTRVEGAAAATYTAATEVGRSRTGVVDVPLPSPGTTYGISLFSRDWSGNLSPAATAQVTSQTPSVVTLGAPPARVAFRTPVRLSGRLTAVGEPLAGRRVVLLMRRAGTTTQSPIRSATTGADGTYALSVTPSTTAEYQVRFEGDATHERSLSPKRVTSVVPLVSLQLSSSRVARGAAVVLSGSVAPVHAGQVVSVQRSVGGGTWRTLGSTRLSSTSGYRYALRPGTSGTWTLRVVRPADADNLAGTSAARTLTVR